MKALKKNWIVFSILFVVTAVMAAQITDDVLKLGKPGSSSDKQLVFDTGDGANNPKIVIDMVDKDFDFNKAVNIAGDLLKVGDGTNTNKEVVFDIGAGVNNPRFRWNSTNNVLEFSVDGAAYKKIGSGSGGGGGINALQDLNFDFETGTPPQDWTASGGTFIAETTLPLFGEQAGSWDASALNQTLDSALAPITSGYLGRICQAEITYKYASGSNGDYQLIARKYDDSLASEVDVAILDLTVTGTDSRLAQLVFDCPDDVADDLRVRIQAKVADPGIILVDDAFIGTGKTFFAKPQDVFSASVSTTGVVSRENIDWISGNCTNANPSVCTIPAGIFNSVPNCQCTTQDNSPITGEQSCIYDVASTPTSLRFHRTSLGALSSRSFNITCQKTDSNANKEAVNYETSGGSFRVAFANDCAWSRSASGLGTFTADASCTFENNFTKGALSLAYEGSPGSVLPGIVVTSKVTSRLFLCMDTTTALISVTGGDYASLVMQFQDAVSGTFGVTQQGHRTIGGSDNLDWPYNLCGAVDLQAGVPATIRILGSKTSGTGNLNLKASGVSSTFALQISGFLIDNNLPAPVFTEVQQKMNAGESGMNFGTARLDVLGAIVTEHGNWIDTISRPSTGQYLINFNSGFCTGGNLPVCTANAFTAADVSVQIGDLTTSQVDIRTQGGNSPLTATCFCK